MTLVCFSLEKSFASSHTSFTPESPSKSPSEVDSVDANMNSGYSSLSTTLSLKTSPSPPPNEDSKYRYFSRVLNDSPDETNAGEGRVLLEKEAESVPAPALERREAEQGGSDAAEREEDAFSGVFKATLVDLEPESPVSTRQDALPLFLRTPPGSPEEIEESPSQFDMDSLVDTLKNMGLR
ncbi:hypothetical protein WMY93_020120 [Mugilogobius chulae]|uniref:Uncharacterized protein n=1 Tax=Mugilogobius chulae TaxID=88201 RepID=A0AAW0NS64_9GOBI